MLLMRKYDEENSACLLSHPVRGAWIEIANTGLMGAGGASHPVRGAWIEINGNVEDFLGNPGRTPSGVRGLKSLRANCEDCGVVVAPRQGCVD